MDHFNMTLLGSRDHGLELYVVFFVSMDYSSYSMYECVYGALMSVSVYDCMAMLWYTCPALSI